MVFIALFQQYFSYIMAVRFIGRGNQKRHQFVASHCQTLSHNVVYSTPRSPWEGFKLKTFVVLDTDYISSCKSNYHMITITTACWNKRFRTKNNSLKNDLMHSYCNNEICVVAFFHVYVSKLVFCILHFIFIPYITLNTFPISSSL